MLPPVQQEVIKLIFNPEWLQMFYNSRATLQHPSVLKKTSGRFGPNAEAFF